MNVQTHALTGLWAEVTQRGCIFLKGQIKGLVDNIYMCVMQLIYFTGNDLCCDGSCCLWAQSYIRGKTKSIFTQEGAITRSVQMRVGCGGPKGSWKSLKKSSWAEMIRLVYSGCGPGVSLALLSVILFSSSSSDRRSKELPSTGTGRLLERLEEKLMGPPRLQERDKFDSLTRDFKATYIQQYKCQ